MSIDTMDKLVAGLTNGDQRSNFQKLGTAQVVSARWASLFRVAGLPGAGATAASGAGSAPTRATAGALRFANPAGGKNKHLAIINAFATQIGQLLVYDRLVETSGLDSNITTSQTFGGGSTAALPTGRDGNGGTNGDSVELWLEVYTQLGATARTINVTYTNSVGTSGQVGTATIGGGSDRDVGRMIPVSLAAGDVGVRSVQSVQIQTAGTGTSGNFGVTLLRKLVMLDMPVGSTGWIKGPFEGGFPQLFPDSCLALAFYSSATTSANLYGQLTYAEEV